MVIDAFVGDLRQLLYIASYQQRASVRVKGLSSELELYGA